MSREYEQEFLLECADARIRKLEAELAMAKAALSTPATEAEVESAIFRLVMESGSTHDHTQVNRSDIHVALEAFRQSRESSAQ